MKAHDIVQLGYPSGKAIGLALEAAQIARQSGAAEASIRDALFNVLESPADYQDDRIYGKLARALDDLARHPERAALVQETPAAPDDEDYDLAHSAPCRIWGERDIEPGALDQMKRAIRLPIALRGALMPDAHQGYGLPIGGVLATENSVIPYAVGVDIACRMRLTVFNAQPEILNQRREHFRETLETQTCFGAGETWPTPRDHDVMDDRAWDEHPVARRFRDVAWKQLGTSGSGNHFVEFGELRVHTMIDSPHGAIQPGHYLGLLSHSGSRRFGFEMANHYTRMAMDRRRRLPKEFQHLAWLSLDEEAGVEYWQAMTLAGRYASANHAVIHRQIVNALGIPVLGGIENHHNFAWKEPVDGREAIVHRKGATPAGRDVLGVIPGSMSAPGFVVRGLGNAASLNSAAHGAGRRMSRSEAFRTFNWEDVRRRLEAQGIELLSAGLDEAPDAYKDIRQVMADQSDLVVALAEFHPRLVKMDPSGKGKGGRRKGRKSKRRR